MESYLFTNNPYPLMQSGYRKHHSTETVLIKLFNDVGCALDEGRNAMLILLDLSSAFDMIDHELLIERLQVRFGITGNALIWLKSYLSQRHTTVSINGFHSISRTVLRGVPQGSVLGPLLFNLFISPIEDIIHDHQLSVLLYADDTQLYISIKPSTSEETKIGLETCLSTLRNWFIENKLTLTYQKY